jgi:hypothetical protein
MPVVRTLSLSDTQLVILSRASQRDDGRIVLPDHLRGGAAAKVMGSLLAQGLILETDTLEPLPFARPTVGPCYTITEHGLAALGLGSGAEPPDFDSGQEQAACGSQAVPVPADAGSISRAKRAEPKGKQAVVISLLGAEAGASLETLISATGWQAHTVRVVLSGFRKRGLSVERWRDEDDNTRYRIGSGPTLDHGAKNVVIGTGE